MISENNIAIAAIDLGNSKVKILLDKSDVAFNYHDGWADILIEILLKSENSQIVVGVSSVRPDKFNELKKISSLYPKVRIINVLECIANDRDCIQTSVQGFGADRLFGLYGALLHIPPPLFTVDCGTAMTINFLDSSCVFRGGAILPGMGSQLHALHEFTEQLPFLEAVSPSKYTGTATAAAMMAGVVGGAGGAVRRLVENMWAEAEDYGIPRIIVTGGEASVLLPELADWPLSVAHFPHLVREGILHTTQRIIEREQHGNTP